MDADRGHDRIDDLRTDERNAGGQHAGQQREHGERDGEPLARRPDEFEGVPRIAEDFAEPFETGECTFGGGRPRARAR